jgi:hypothetical protein
MQIRLRQKVNLDPHKALDTFDAAIKGFTALEHAIKHDNPRMVEWRYKSYGLNWATFAKWWKRTIQMNTQKVLEAINAALQAPERLEPALDQMTVRQPRVSYGKRAGIF